MLKRETKKAEEESAPLVCDDCGRPMVAQFAGGRYCLRHYEARKEKKPDFVHAELMRRIAEHPEWQPMPNETSQQYQRRMFKTWRPMMARLARKMQA